ncbi:MAG: methyl-accepting chemotaxis protein [Caulobacteraceae bacterium]
MYQNNALGRNETDVNDLLVRLYKIVLVTFPLIALLKFTGLIAIPLLHFAIIAGVGILTCLLPIVCRMFRMDSAALKYISIYCAVVLVILCYVYLHFTVILLFIIPISFANLYFDGKLIRRSVILAILGLAAGEFLNSIVSWKFSLSNLPVYLNTAIFALQFVILAVIQFSAQKRANKMIVHAQSIYENINDLFSNAYATSQNLQSAEEKLVQEVSVLGEGIEKQEEIVPDAVEEAAGTANAAVKAIFSNINKTVENTKEIMKYTHTMLKNSGNGKGPVFKEDYKAGSIEEYAKKSKESIASLAKYTEKIKDDLNLLSVIIDESKLLSVNAAVEAENASSSGKGSVILAMKVEKLADQSAESASYIQELLNGIVNDAEVTVKSMIETYDEVFKSLDLINRTVDTLIKWLMYKNMH